MKKNSISQNAVGSTDSPKALISTAIGHDDTQRLFAAAANGWRLFPLKRGDKKPLVKWRTQATSDPETLRGWLRKYPNCNWAVATGSASDILVIDVDTDGALDEFNKMGKRPNTYTVKTGHGYHFYFRYSSDSPIRNSASTIAAGLDVRGEGGYVVIPPSVHPNGAIYKVIEDVPVASLPKWLLQLLNRQSSPIIPRTNSDDSQDIRAVIPEGKRNTKLASLAGTMWHRGMVPDAIEAALLKENSAHCATPLPEDEVRSIVRSITRYESGSVNAADEEKLVLGSKPIDQLALRAEQILRDVPEERLFRTPNTPRLVRVIQYGETLQDETVRRDPEVNIMVEAESIYLLRALSRSGKVYKYNERLKELVWADPTRRIAEMMLSSVRTSPELTSWKLLRMLSRSPILLPNGIIEKQPGYSPAGEIWLDLRGVDFDDTAERNPRLTAKEARRMVEEYVHPPFERYEFAKEHAEQEWHQTPSFAVVLSAMFSIAARNLLPTVHITCVDAPEMGSGKTKLAAAISAGMTGTRPSAVSYDGADEFSKHLPPLLEQGDRVILVDNVNMTVACDRLAIALTQDGTYSYRPLGMSQTRKVENRAVVILTGNNLTLSGDIPRRSLIARIMPEAARPEYRKFLFDPVERARQLFPKMVMAVLAAMRAHMLAEFPGLMLQKSVVEAGSFTEWNKWVRAALLWMEYADPLRSQEAIRNTDPARAAHEELLILLHQAIRDRECSVRQVKDHLNPGDLPRFQELTGHKPNETFSELKVGQFFGRIRDQYFGDSKLYKLSSNKSTGGKRQWRIEIREQEVSRGDEEAF